MGKYKVRKPEKGPDKKNAEIAEVAAGAEVEASAAAAGQQPINLKRRMPPGTIRLQFAGEMILARPLDRQKLEGFTRYQILFEGLANMEKMQRQIIYRFLNGLMITSHCRKMKDADQRRSLFELKNKIFFSIANNNDLRRRVAFKYLLSKRPRVVKFCDACTERQTREQLPLYKWHFCENCTTDASYYNVLSMLHRFKEGQACMFLSNELIAQLTPFDLAGIGKGKLDDVHEEAVLSRFHFGTSNLDAIHIESVVEMNRRLLS